jgi:hypothetical protein
MSSPCLPKAPDRARSQRRVAASALAGALALCFAVGCGDDDSDGTPEMMQGPASRGDGDASAGGDASALGNASSDAGGDAPIVLVGAVDDSDIRLGAVIAADRIRVFFCGGPSSYASATQWLQAQLAADGSFAFESDALQLQGQLDGGRLRGELTRAGERALAFSAERVRAGTLAGLYESEAECGRVGLIVTQRSPSDAPSAQGACVGPGHAPEQVNPILPLALDEDGALAVEVVRADGTEPASVQPASPPTD